MARRSLPLALAIGLLFAVPAAADNIDYTVTGNFGTVTFSLPQFPTPTWYFSGFFYEFDGISTSAGIDNIAFRGTLIGGGMDDTAEATVGLGIFDLTGPELYTINQQGYLELLPGTFQVLDVTGAPATIEAVLVPGQVPEPASWALVGSGLAGLCMRRRKRLAASVSSGLTVSGGQR